MIDVAGLSFTHAGAPEPALRGIDLRVAPGELLFVVGGNGSGKSTLLHCLSGLAPRLVPGERQGTVLIDGKPVGGSDIARPPVGVALQDSDTYLLEEVGQEIAYPLLNRERTAQEARKRAREVAERLGIGHLLDRQMSTLSGGERQKVALCAALVVDAPVLLLDEPTEQLDPEAAHEVFGLLRVLARSGKTIVVTARRADYAWLYADRILFMENGGLCNDANGGMFAVPPASGARPASRRDGNGGGDRGVPPVVFECVTHLFPGGGGVRDIDLALEQGEVLALMGPNGAGKSTLVKHCPGLLRPQAGRVLVGGADSRGLPTWRLTAKVGILFQNPDDQIFNERVDKEIAWGLTVKGWREKEALAEAHRVLDALGGAGWAGRHPYSLARSQRQLVALASVLAAWPEVIILDEPTKAMDDRLAFTAMAAVEAHRRQGASVIAVTHDPVFAWAFADRVAVVREGRLLAAGETRDVMLDREIMHRGGLSRHPFVQALWDGRMK